MDFLQIGGNEPLGAGANPTKFGVNWTIISMFAKKRFREIAIFAKKRFCKKQFNTSNFHKCCSIFLQIGGDLPLGLGVNPTNFGVNRPC
jgi:hypothetical protein